MHQQEEKWILAIHQMPLPLIIIELTRRLRIINWIWVITWFKSPVNGYLANISSNNSSAVGSNTLFVFLDGEWRASFKVFDLRNCGSNNKPGRISINSFPCYDK